MTDRLPHLSDRLRNVLANREPLEQVEIRNLRVTGLTEPEVFALAIAYADATTEPDQLIEKATGFVWGFNLACELMEAE